MKNPELFNHTVSILVKAYQNDTLVHGNCYACAVGNLVAANMGIGFVRDMKNDTLSWNDRENCYAFSSKPVNNWFKAIYHGKVIKTNLTEEVIKEIESTGYTLEEIAKIEWAFENTIIEDYQEIDFESDDYMYMGLMSVIDCLMLIHEADVVEVNNAKELFVKV